MLTTAIRTGFGGATGNLRLVVFFYLLNLLCAAVVIYPFSLGMLDFGGTSLLSRNLTAGPDASFIFEFIHASPDTMSMTGGLLLIAACLYELLLLVLAAGTITHFHNGSGFRSDEFWGEGFRFMGRYLRLFFWSLPLLGVAFALQYAVKLVLLLFWGSDPASDILFDATLIRIALGGFGLFMYGQVLDYARIACVVTDERSAWRSLLRGLKFFFTHYASAAVLGLTFALTGLLMTAVYFKATGGMIEVRGITLIVAIILQQLYMFVRAMLRVGLIAGQVDFRIACEGTDELTAPQPGLSPGVE